MLLLAAISFHAAAFTCSRAEEPPRTSNSSPAVTAGAGTPEIARPTRKEARRQAETLHRALHATLQIVHHRYYREDEGLPIPAAVMKDVFAELEKEQQIKLRWLVVEGQAMNTDHKAKDDFEVAAVKALKSGQQEYDEVQDGVYRRAGAITLSNHCLKCHVPDRKNTNDRTAGLIIAIPIQDD